MEIQNFFFSKEMSLYTNDKSNTFVFPPIIHELNSFYIHKRPKSFKYSQMCLSLLVSF